MNHLQRQSGMTLIGWAVVLALILLFAIVAIRLTPVYIEYFSVSSAVATVARDANGKTPSEIRNELERRFEVNNIDIITPRDVQVVNDNGQISLSFNYEHRAPFIGNIDFLLTFHKRFRVPGS